MAKILYNSRGLVVISVLIKYYMPLALTSKVIKLIKFKSAMKANWQLYARRNRESAFYCKTFGSDLSITLRPL